MGSVQGKFSGDEIELSNLGIFVSLSINWEFLQVEEGNSSRLTPVAGKGFKVAERLWF